MSTNKASIKYIYNFSGLKKPFLSFLNFLSSWVPVVISKNFNKGGSGCNHAHILGVTKL